MIHFYIKGLFKIYIIEILERRWERLNAIIESKQREKVHEKKVKEAKEDNSLFECSICMNDELLADEMSQCTEGHLFCK
jgi:hypothetical protein